MALWTPWFGEFEIFYSFHLYNFLPTFLSFFACQPTAFIEHLSKYRKSMDEIELKEKQLAAMRVDVCSTEALKKLKGQ